MNSPNDRPNLVDRFFIRLSRPENLARIIRWAWLISLMMLVLGYIIIYTKVRHLIPI
ncbi:ATP synthase subunit G [Methanolobus chelungpuianus]|uniref:ATP synthase subunit G n=1 Tax=Methanolobus chelungpuianus TaxID=502115 RepID=A0AAE3HAX2_9EURY|nr:ATP synthase subunit G [Methanolobus chelungpuianus]